MQNNKKQQSLKNVPLSQQGGRGKSSNWFKLRKLFRDWIIAVMAISTGFNLFYNVGWFEFKKDEFDIIVLTALVTANVVTIVMLRLIGSGDDSDT